MEFLTTIDMRRLVMFIAALSLLCRCSKDDVIENVEVDLTGYYTKEEVDDKFLELEIEKILNGVTTSLSIVPSGVFETNVETEITVKYNVNNFTLSDKSVLSLTIKRGNTIVATGTGETVSCSDKISKTT